MPIKIYAEENLQRQYYFHHPSNSLHKTCLLGSSKKVLDHQMVFYLMNSKSEICFDLYNSKDINFAFPSTCSNLTIETLEQGVKYVQS